VNLIQALILGIVEGITEFLPISSTGHLTIAEKLMGFSITSPDITAFTAIIQVGAIFATLLYFRQDIIRIVVAWVRGVFSKEKRSDVDYRFGWAVIIGSLPIGIIGILFKDQIQTTLRSLWFVGFALLLWSVVMWMADQLSRQTRKTEDTANWRDTVIIGIVQCLAFVPGVSRSGATISAGLFRGFDRVAATKLSFFLAIPALLAAGALQAVSQSSNISSGVGWGPTIVATVVSFIVAYISIAWLLKFIAKHNFSLFIGYRIALGVVLIVLLVTHTITAT
jgi:undecaprenyl-diphosphatase